MKKTKTESCSNKPKKHPVEGRLDGISNEQLLSWVMSSGIAMNALMDAYRELKKLPVDWGDNIEELRNMAACVAEILSDIYCRLCHSHEDKKRYKPKHKEETKNVH